MSFESSTESSCVITVKFNGNTVGIISGNYDTYFDDHRNFLHLLFYPLFDDRRRICNLALGHSSIDHYYCNSPYRNFTQLDFSCSNSLSLLSGSTLKIWGEK